MSRLFLAVGLIAWSFGAQADDWELGARYWLSNGTTVRSHNAQGVVPTLGNPTSVLTYEDLDAHAVELHARRNFGERWFIRGNAGIGWIRGGSFDDEDFFADQVKFSDSTSVVKGNRLSYATIDIGSDVWTVGPAITLGLFAGYHHWVERLDAYGATFTVGTGNIGESVPVITNEVAWNSLRLGLAVSARPNPRTRISADLAWVPHAEVRDEDSHHLRTSPSDLGPTPNIIMQGDGMGMLLDVELRHDIRQNWALGVGLWHWWLRATSGSRRAADTILPLTELESRRTGLTFSLTRRW